MDSLLTNLFSKKISSHNCKYKIFTSLFGIIPFLGSVVGTVLSLVALIFVFFGWLRIQEGLLEKQ